MTKKKKLRTSDFISCVFKNYGITLKKEKIAPFIKGHQTGSGSPTQPPRPAGTTKKKNRIRPTRPLLTKVHKIAWPPESRKSKKPDKSGFLG